jgi:hypothetical protein
MKVVGGGPVLDDLAVLDAADHDPQILISLACCSIMPP